MVHPHSKIQNEIAQIEAVLGIGTQDIRLVIDQGCRRVRISAVVVVVVAVLQVHSDLYAIIAVDLAVEINLESILLVMVLAVWIIGPALEIREPLTTVSEYRIGIDETLRSVTISSETQDNWLKMVYKHGCDCLDQIRRKLGEVPPEVWTLFVKFSLWLASGKKFDP